MHLADLIPDADALVDLGPEVLAHAILKVLNSWPAHQALQLSTFIATSAGPYPPNRRGELQEALSTVWAWLEGRALLIHDPRYGEGVVKLSLRAHKLAKEPSPVWDNIIESGRKAPTDPLMELAELIGGGGQPQQDDPRRRSEFSALPSPQASSPKIFVVHGRDDAAKNELALFLRTIGLEPIILHLRPNGGRHLLTKFREECEGAGFAVILMTPDDVGGLEGGTQHPRARQNVVFELGFFIGKLGPASVAALLKGDVEKPSDFAGIAYINFDRGGDWKRELAREMYHAKVPFDTAKVLTA